MCTNMQAIKAHSISIISIISIITQSYSRTEEVRSPHFQSNQRYRLNLPTREYGTTKSIPVWAGNVLIGELI